MSGGASPPRTPSLAGPESLSWKGRRLEEGAAFGKILLKALRLGDGRLLPLQTFPGQDARCHFDDGEERAPQFVVSSRVLLVVHVERAVADRAPECHLGTPSPLKDLFARLPQHEVAPLVAEEELFRKTEVEEEDHVALFCQTERLAGLPLPFPYQIFGFDISMDEALIVDVLQGLHGLQDAQGGRRREATSLLPTPHLVHHLAEQSHDHVGEVGLRARAVERWHIF